jgi:hypothetical protein
MAFLLRRRDGRIELREARATPRGPRARTLASFRGALDPEVLERAAARASRPLDVPVLLARARALGIPVTERRGDRAARELLAQLRRGGSVDASLAAILREALEPLAASAPPEALAEVAEWVGADDAQRGTALRGLLRLHDRIARSRGAVRSRPRRSYPRFRSARGRS